MQNFIYYQPWRQHYIDIKSNISIILYNKIKKNKNIVTPISSEYLRAANAILYQWVGMKNWKIQVITYWGEKEWKQCEGNCIIYNVMRLHKSIAAKDTNWPSCKCLLENMHKKNALTKSFKQIQKNSSRGKKTIELS